MPIHLRVNARPTPVQIDTLALSVGWGPFGDRLNAALDGYSVTTSGWTDEGRLVAWTSVVSDEVAHAFLLDVMVHPDFQRQGVGRQVVHLAIDQMRQRGITTFHVDCAPDRAGFYERCGFNLCAGGWLDTAKELRSVNGEAATTSSSTLGAPPVTVREITVADRQEWARLRSDLWPDSAADHELETCRYFANRETLPVVFVAEGRGRLVGFLELDLRKYAAGCHSSPVPFIEGWYVEPRLQKQGIGQALIAAAEAWASAAGHDEIASDAEIINQVGIAAHRAVGFEEVERVVCFRKTLTTEN